MTAVVAAFTMGPGRGWVLFGVVIVWTVAAAVLGELSGRRR